MRKTILALLSATFLIGAAPVAAKTRALVIGINAYPEITVNGVGGQRDLRGAVNDAKNMQAALTKFFDVKPEEVRLLVDADASRDNILGQFREWLIDGTASGDRAIFYFAGHGAQVPDEDGDEGEDKFDEVLAPSDTRGELQGSTAGLSGFILDDEIEELVAGLSGREVMMIVDACHSGTITRGTLEVRKSGAVDDSYTGVRTLTPNGPIGVLPDLEELGTRSAHRTGTRLIAVEEAPVVVAAAVEQPVETPADQPAAEIAVETGAAEKNVSDLIAVWTAVASAQLAVEDLELGGGEGLFTNRFVKGIADGSADLNKNGRITASELLAYLRSESEAYCKEFACGPGGLTPTLEANVGYDGETIVELAVAEAPKEETAPEEKPAEATPVGAQPVETKPVEAVMASSDAIPEQGHEEAAGGLTLTLSTDGKMHLGDALRVTVHTEFPGELIILDVRDDGTTVQLFPNGFSLKVGVVTYLNAGETRYVPGDLDPFVLVPDAPGTGRIVAIVVDDATTVANITKQFLNLEPIPAADRYIAALTREINAAVELPAGSEEALEKPATSAVIFRAEANYLIE
ncbi:MAG: caspase family protein [Propylenella sp.]